MQPTMDIPQQRWMRRNCAFSMIRHADEIYTLDKELTPWTPINLELLGDNLLVVTLIGFIPFLSLTKEKLMELGRCGVKSVVATRES
jgi:hypothetical protein